MGNIGSPGITTSGLQASGAASSIARKTHTFTNAAGQGAIGTVALFTVTGRVLITNRSAYASTTLDDAAGTATLSIGVADAVTALFADPTGSADALVAGLFMTPTAAAPTHFATMPSAIVVEGNIFATVGTAAVTSGVLEVVLQYTPLSVGASVTPA